MVKGWGFVDEDLKILCIKSDEKDNRYLELVPWRQANPNEVIIMWDPGIENLKTVLGSVPFLDLINNTKGIDLDKLETIYVEKDDTTIWIG